MKQLSLFMISLLLILTLLTSCTSAPDSGTTAATQPSDSSYQITDLVGTPSDYTDQNNWLSIPEITHDVDTFYIYPTVYSDSSANAPDIVPIDNESMRAGARYNLSQYGGVYAASTNVFAPYYRQTNMIAYAGQDAESILDLQRREQRTDIFAALDCYFERYNNGRPFILAGHSQGSMMVRIILREYMQAHPGYYRNMVAAYVLGYSFTTDDLSYNPNLKFATGADDTGVVISWNIEGPGNKDQQSIVVCKNAMSINPINWHTDDTYASSDENLGSYQFGDTEPVPIGVKADAQVDPERGVVICTVRELPFISATSPASEIYFGTESYHNGDYLFYLDNIKENVRLRADAFTAEHKVQ